MWLTGYGPRYKVPLQAHTGQYPREDTPVQVEVDLTRALTELEIQGTFDRESLRLVELHQDGSLVGGVPVQFDPGVDFDPAGCARGTVAWILAGYTPPNAVRRYELYFDILENGPKKAPATTCVTFSRLMEWGADWDRAMDVEIGGELFTIYNYGQYHSHPFKPYFHPLIGPSGKSITQCGEYPGTMKGHYWHRGLFVAHGHVNDGSFWEEREFEPELRSGSPASRCGRQIHQEFTELIEGPVYGRFTARNLWRQHDDRDVLEEHRRLVFYNLPADRRIVDIRLTLQTLDKPVIFGTRPYNLLACRFADAMNVAKDAPRYSCQFHGDYEGPPRQGGLVLSSEGDINVAGLHEGPGRNASWMDHSGPNGPAWEGMAMFDSPTNERYPTWWLNWNNMTMGPSFTYNEPYTLPAGEKVMLNYRLYLHSGDAWTGQVAQRFEDYTNPVEILVGTVQQVAVS